MIGQPYNPNECAFLMNQSLNANQFNDNVPNASNSTNHIVLWNFAESKLLWVNSLTGLIEYEIVGASGTPNVSLQQVLDFNHDLINGNNFQGTKAGFGNTGTNVIAIGEDAAKENTGNDVNAIGVNAASSNIGSIVNAIGTSAAYTNQGDNVNAFGLKAAQENTGDNVNSIGQSAAQENTGDNVNAIGQSAATKNEGEFVNAIGENAARENEGSNVNAFGIQAAYQNTGDNVIAIGSSAGQGNTLSTVFILSNTELPTFVDHAAALLVLGSGAAGNTYIYHNQSTNSIGAVRL